MTYLKLVLSPTIGIRNQGLYLMKGGTDKFIDKIGFEIEGNTKKITLPKEWLIRNESAPLKTYHPGSLVIEPLESKTLKPFRELTILQQFGLPIDYEEYSGQLDTKNIFNFNKSIYRLIKNKIEFLSEDFRKFAPPAASISVNPNFSNKTIELPEFIFTKRDDSTSLLSDSVVFSLSSSFSNKVGYTDPSIGDIYLWGIWMSGLTIHPHILRPTVNQGDYKRYIFKIYERPTGDLISHPTNMQTLDSALKLLDANNFKNINTIDGILSKLHELTEIEIVRFLDIDNYTDIRFELRGSLTFTEVMDRVVGFIGCCSWDWQGDHCAYLNRCN